MFQSNSDARPPQAQLRPLFEIIPFLSEVRKGDDDGEAMIPGPLNIPSYVIVVFGRLQSINPSQALKRAVAAELPSLSQLFLGNTHVETALRLSEVVWLNLKKVWLNHT